MNLPDPIWFTTPFNGRMLAGDLLTDRNMACLLILHGAGQSSRHKFSYLRERFHQRGIGSCAFDFIGHGDTGGELKQSSLLERTEQACRVIDTQPIRQPLTIIGASMGAYTAVKLTRLYPVDNLVLLVPAMYAAEAYTVSFNSGFTEIIQKPDSWIDSDAWEILTQFSGRLLIVAAEFDRVIPSGVIRRIHESAVKAEQNRLYTAPGVSHFVFSELRAKNPKEFETIFEMMIETVAL